MAQGHCKFVVAGGEVSVFIEVADDELDCQLHLFVEGQSSQLPRQVIGESRWLGEKVLKRGLLAVFIFRLCAVAGIKVVLKIRSEVDLLEGVFGSSRGFRNSRVASLKTFDP